MNNSFFWFCSFFPDRYQLHRMNRSVVALLLLAGLSSCHSLQPGESGKRLKLNVGEIKEISLSAPKDSTVQIVGTSDNNEVVDVSQKPVIGSTTQSAGSMVFLLKGVTVGTANVIFSDRKPGEAGAGHIRRTYKVQVTTP